MAKKRRRLDEYLSQRTKSHEVMLEEKTQLSNRLFHLSAAIVFTLILVVMALPNDSRNLSYVFGLGLLFFLLLGLVVLTLTRVQPGLFRRAAAFNQLVGLVVVQVLLYEFVSFEASSFEVGGSPNHSLLYVTPLALFAMVGALVFTERGTLILSFAMAFYVGATSPHGQVLPENPLGMDFSLMLVLAVGAATASLSIKPVRRQSKPVMVGLYAGIMQALTLLCLKLMAGELDLQEGEGLKYAHLSTFLVEPGWALAGGLFSGALVTCLLPWIERVFGILTERRLLDLSDFSNDLLRLIQERAPGTFQHTLNVAQLCSSASEAVGADPLLARVGCYYHDLGKIHKPEYFVENMGEDKTIHDRLSPSMSKMIIISHVKDGVVLAKEAKLPQKIIDMIPMHHGTTVVEFFYYKARRFGEPESLAPGEVEYRYPGPKPRFREAGIMMLADTLEAMAKAETHPNPSRFRTMVHEVILKRLLDGQLDESDLTLNDLRVIEDSFVRTLTTMYHGRIKYPAPDEEGSKKGRGRGSKGGSGSQGGGGGKGPEPKPGGAADDDAAPSEQTGAEGSLKSPREPVRAARSS